MTDKSSIKSSDFDGNQLSESIGRISSGSNNNNDGNIKNGTYEGLLITNSMFSLNEDHSFNLQSEQLTDKDSGKIYNASSNENEENNLNEIAHESPRIIEDLQGNSVETENTSSNYPTTYETSLKKSPFNPNAQEFFPKINPKQGLTQISNLATKVANPPKKTVNTTSSSVLPVSKNIPISQPISKANSKVAAKKAALVIPNTNGTNPFSSSKVPIKAQSTLNCNSGIVYNSVNTTNTFNTTTNRNINISSHNQNELKVNPNNTQSGIFSSNNSFNFSNTNKILTSSSSTNSPTINSNISQISTNPSPNLSQNDFFSNLAKSSTSPLLDPSRRSNDNLINQMQSNNNIIYGNQPKRHSLPINQRKNPVQQQQGNQASSKTKTPPPPPPNNLENKSNLINKSISSNGVEETINNQQNSLSSISSNYLNKDYVNHDFDIFDLSDDKIYNNQRNPINRDKIMEENNLQLQNNSFLMNKDKLKSTTSPSENSSSLLINNLNSMPTSPSMNYSSNLSTSTNSHTRQSSFSWEKIEFSGNFSGSTDDFLIVECNNKIYCCGNWTSIGAPAELYYYQFVDGKGYWQKLGVQGNPPIILSKMILLAGQNKLYVFGGQANDVMDFYNLFELDLDNRIWLNIKIQHNDDLLLTCQDFSVTLLNGIIYLFGGVFSDNLQSNNIYFLNDFWGLNIQEGSWQMIKYSNLDEKKSKNNSDIPHGRAGHSSVAYRQSLYLFGGSINDDEFNDLYEFNTITNNWSKIICTGFIPPPRYCHSAGVIGDTMIIFGGYGGENGFLADIHEFNFTNFTWTKIIPKESSVAPIPRFRHYSAILDNNLYILGGKGSVIMDNSFSGSGRPRVAAFCDCYKINLTQYQNFEKNTTKLLLNQGKSNESQSQEQQQQHDVPVLISTLSNQLGVSDNKIVSLLKDDLPKVLDELLIFNYQKQNFQNDIVKKDAYIKELNIALQYKTRNIEELNNYIKVFLGQIQKLQNENNKLQQEIERLKIEKVRILESKKMDSTSKSKYGVYNPLEDYVSHNNMFPSGPSLPSNNNIASLESIKINENNNAMLNNSQSSFFRQQNKMMPFLNNDLSLNFLENIRGGSHKTHSTSSSYINHHNVNSIPSHMSSIPSNITNAFQTSNNNNNNNNNNNINSASNQTNNISNYLNPNNSLSSHTPSEQQSANLLSKMNNSHSTNDLVLSQDMVREFLLSNYSEPKSNSNNINPVSNSTAFNLADNIAANSQQQTQQNLDIDLSKLNLNQQNALPILNILKNYSNQNNNNIQMRNNKKGGANVSNSYNINNMNPNPSPPPSQFVNTNNTQRFDNSSMGSYGPLNTNNNQSFQNINYNNYSQIQNQRQQQQQQSIWNNRFLNSTEVQSNFSKELKDNLPSHGNNSSMTSGAMNNNNNISSQHHQNNSNLRSYLNDNMNPDFSRFSSTSEMSPGAGLNFNEENQDNDSYANYNLNNKSGFNPLQATIEKSQNLNLKTSNTINNNNNNKGLKQNNQFSQVHQMNSTNHFNTSMFMESNKLSFPNQTPPPPPPSTPPLTNNLLNNLNLNSVSNISGNNFNQNNYPIKNNGFNFRTSENLLSNENISQSTGFNDARRPGNQVENYEWNISNDHIDESDSEYVPDWA